MIKGKKVMDAPPRAKQRGAVLVVSLVFLLILTTLAVTNMREVALESRITGNLVNQKQLTNASEAGLRDGEFRTIGVTKNEAPGQYDLLTALEPLNALETCPPNLEAMEPCLIDKDPAFDQEWEGAGYAGSQTYSPDENTVFDEDIRWYAIPAPGGSTEGESENPEYGNLVGGIGSFRYEVNSKAESNTGEARHRSTILRVYLN